LHLQFIQSCDERNRFVFLKQDLHPVMRSIVLLHEIGHDQHHRAEAIASGGLREFNIFDMRESRMEYEANIFACQIALPDGFSTIMVILPVSSHSAFSSNTESSAGGFICPPIA
jgi:Zn-dependent peptidase ImmA (M78 family)